LEGARGRVITELSRLRYLCDRDYYAHIACTQMDGAAPVRGIPFEFTVSDADAQDPITTLSSLQSPAFIKPASRLGIEAPVMAMAPDLARYLGQHEAFPQGSWPFSLPIFPIPISIN